MMAQLIDRKHLKQEMKELLRSAQVSPRGMTCLYLALVLVLNLADSFMGLMNPGLLGTFISILTGLMSMVLASGFVMYCMAIRRGELFMLDLSYIGWLLLASLTSVVQTGYIYACIFQDPGYYLANPAQVYAITLPMPVGLQVVLGCVWPLLVALFYLPVYQCTELGYFDTAKHTSGVGEGAAPKDPGSFDSGWGGF